jgi:rubrerythrin
MRWLKDTTVLKWVYIFELTAPVFYRINRLFIRDKDEKKRFKHFEENELPHSPMIKDFLREHYNMGVYPIPKALIRFVTMLVSFFIGIFGKKAIYYFEYRFEKKAVEAYTNLMNDTDDLKIKELAKQLCDEELPHREYFREKLGIKVEET